MDGSRREHRSAAERGTANSLVVRPFAGRIVVLAAVSLAVGGGSACTPGAHEGEAQRPNVILISVDTLRADHLGSYGYERATSPNCDALAARGVLFERCFSSSSWTLPAHLSMLTGLPVSAHGVCDDRLWARKDARGEALPIPLRGTFVSETLTEAGYRCGGFYSWKYLEPQFGFGPGFETWERLGHTFYSHPEVGPRFEELRLAGDTQGMKALMGEYPELFDDARPSSGEVIDRALRWLDDDDDQPFFLFVHLFDVHDPYVPPAPYDKLFDPDYDGPIDGRRITSPDSDVRGDMPARDLEHLIALYDGEIAHVDAQLGRFVQALEERGLMESSLLLLTSDHGEEFFEHGHKTHRRQLFVESTQVPLVMVWPGHLPAGERIAETVGLIDLVPTIQHATNASDSAALPGTDLVSIASGAAAGPRTYLSELLLFQDAAAPVRQAGIVRGSRHWLFETRADEPWRGQVFDLDRDPQERRPELVDAQAAEELLAPLRTRLRALRAGAKDRAALLPQLSEHDRSQLAAMGYAGIEDERGSDGQADLCLKGCVWNARSKD